MSYFTYGNWKCVFFANPNLPETPSESEVMARVLFNGDPGVIRVKCLARKHINRFFTLSAPGFIPSAFRLLPNPLKSRLPPT